VVHGERRYTPAPIALFYWNASPPQGYPRGYLGDGSSRDGVLQPVAIRLEPSGPVFTPPSKSGEQPGTALEDRQVLRQCGVRHPARVGGPPRRLST
jgi:arachidonate 15-lipoxygenase